MYKPLLIPSYDVSAPRGGVSRFSLQSCATKKEVIAIFDNATRKQDPHPAANLLERLRACHFRRPILVVTVGATKAMTRRPKIDHLAEYTSARPKRPDRLNG